jgi:hypothetical protein
MTPTHRRVAPAAASATPRPVCAPILELGLRGAYTGRAVADLAYKALTDTHTEHPADLGFNRG